MAVFDPKRSPFGGNARQDFNHELAIQRARDTGGMRAWLAHVDASNLYKLNALRDVVDIRIWRTHGDDALFLSAPDAKRWIDERLKDLQRAGIQPQDIWLSLNNEAGVPAEQAAWEVTAIEHGLKYGLNFVPGNPSVGSPDPHEIARYKPVLELANEHPNRIIIGLHEYFYIFHDNYNTPLIWHVGRGKNWREYCDLNGLFAVRFGVTEAGSDDLNDVNKRDPGKWRKTIAPDNETFNQFRGIWTLDEAYKQMFGADYELLGLGGLAAREMRYAWEKAWSKYADFTLWYSVGEAFNSGWHGPTPWPAFNNESMDAYWTYLAAYWNTREQPQPEPELMLVTTDRLNVRSKPALSASIVGSVKKGDLVQATESVIADGYLWRKIAQGWVAQSSADGSGALMIAAPTQPEPIPGPPPPPLPVPKPQPKYVTPDELARALAQLRADVRADVAEALRELADSLEVSTDESKEDAA